MKIYSKMLDTESLFRKEDEIKKAIVTSKKYKNEPTETAKSLIFFKTSKQRSYLVTTKDRVYCVVDDIRRDRPIVNWSERATDFLKRKISIRKKSSTTGLVDFGEEHKDWLVSLNKIKDENQFKNELSKILSESKA